MIDLATTVLTGTGILAGAGLLAGHGWRSRTLGARFAALGQRLNEIEASMYAHDEPDQVPPRATEFALPGVDGKGVSLERLLALGKPVLLLFTDPDGVTGQSLISTISAWQRRHDSPLTVVGIGPAGKVASWTRSDLPFGITDLLAPPPGDTIASDFGIALTPAVVLIRPNGAIVGPPVVGMQGIQSLLATLAEAAAEAARIRQGSIESGAPVVGMRAPRVLLPGYDDIDQEVVAPGMAQVLLFWSPDCGYCDQLVHDLHALEASPRPGLPAITLVARGSEAANRVQGFGFRTLFDHDLSASIAFGVYGTPAAVIVDEDGIVASHVARGIRAVRELLTLTSPAH